MEYLTPDSVKVMPNGTIGRKTKKRPQVFGDAFDDVHLCIMCLRAIMNHQYGFNMVIGHGGELGIRKEMSRRNRDGEILSRREGERERERERDR